MSNSRVNQYPSIPSSASAVPPFPSHLLVTESRAAVASTVGLTGSTITPASRLCLLQAGDGHQQYEEYRREPHVADVVWRWKTLN